jgi:hypothetical protein
MIITRYANFILIICSFLQYTVHAHCLDAYIVSTRMTRQCTYILQGGSDVISKSSEKAHDEFFTGNFEADASIRRFYDALTSLKRSQSLVQPVTIA